MKLPNADRAIIDREKTYDYCLNKDHPRGKHKARVFQRTLGLTSENTDELIAIILNSIQNEICSLGEGDEYGQRYIVDIAIHRNTEKAVVRTIWIIKTNESQPRLTTCFVK
jgi:hypothetical protein